MPKVNVNYVCPECDKEIKNDIVVENVKDTTVVQRNMAPNPVTGRSR